MTAAVTDELLLALPCHLVDPDVFFADDPAEVEYAKTLCVGCPMQQACLEGALTRREACGVWGGELIINGKVVAHKRGRGRPRKHPQPIVATPPPTMGVPSRPVARKAA